MFIFTTYQELWAHEVMSHIMSCDYSLCPKDILKFILLFHNIFECNNFVILSLIIFYLNWNQHVNSHRYKIF
jgi:hypothetical protein